MSEKYTGNNITIENFGYNKANINIKAKTEQTQSLGQKGTTIKNVGYINVQDVEQEKAKISISGNAYQNSTNQSANLFDKNNTLPAIGGTTGYISTNYISAKTGDVIKKNNSTTLFFYDSSKTQLGSTPGWTNGTISLENVAYIRCNMLETDKDTFMIVKNQDLPSEYAEFVPESPSPECLSKTQTVGSNINLFDKDNANIVGLYVAKEGDKVLTQATKAKSFYMECEPNNTYTIQKIKGNALAVGYTEEIPTTSSVLYGAIRNDSTSITTTTGENAKYLVVYYNNGSETVTDQQLLDSIKVENGPKATRYSSFGQGSILITKTNKNLIPFAYEVGYKKTTKYGVEYEFLEKHRIKLNGTSEGGALQLYISDINIINEDRIKWKKGQTYTLSLKKVSGTSSASLIAHTSFKNDDKEVWNNLQAGLDKKTTITVEEDGYSPRVVLYSNKETVFNELIIEVQLEVGEVQTEYEDHQSKQLVLPIQQEFVKTGDYEDCFIRRGDNWYEQHIIKKKIFDGTENLTIHTAGTNEDYLTVYTYMSGMKHVPKNNLLSNYFKAINSIGSKNCIYGGYQVEIDISINKTVASNVDEFKAKLAEWKDNGTPMELYYPLATPELIPCTPEQEEVLRKLNNYAMYLPVTNIDTESSLEPNVNLQYNYIPASPSLESASEIRTVGQNTNLISNNIEDWEQGSISGDDGNGITSTTRLRTVNYVNIKKSTKITCNLENTDYHILNVHFYSENYDYLRNASILYNLSNFNKATMDVPMGAEYIKVTIKKINNETIKNTEIEECKLKIESGIIATAYEKQTQINIINKNWLKIDVENQSLNGLTIIKNEGKIIFNGVATKDFQFDIFKNFYLPEDDFVFSAKENGQIQIPTNKPCTYSIRNQDNTQLLGGNIGKGMFTKTIDRTNLGNIIKFMALWITQGTIFSNFEIEMQLEKGIIATEKIPHKSQTIILPIQEEFVKIGNYEDVFVKYNGKWYERHNSPKVVLNGEQSVTYYEAPNVELATTFSTAYFTIGNLGKAITNEFLSDKFIKTYNTAVDIWGKANETDKQEGIFVDTDGTIRLRLRKELLTGYMDDLTATEKADVAKEYLRNNNITIYYPLQNPRMIECTPAQENLLNQLANIQLYEGINHIIGKSSIDPELEVIVTKVIEDYDFYVSSTGKLVIPEFNIEYLIDFYESNIPTMPEATESSVRAAGRDGDIPLKTTYEPIPLNIVCYTEDNLSLTEKVSEETKINKFLNTIKNKTKSLAIEKYNKFYNVKYNGALATMNFPKHLKFEVPLKSSESYGKDLIQKSIIGNSKGESNTIEEAGAIFSIKGPALNPIISFNDYSMEYNMNILEGARIEIDSNKSTITHINSDGIKTNVMKHYNHQFPKVQYGVNELKILSGIEDDLNVSVTWNDLKL